MRLIHKFSLLFASCLLVCSGQSLYAQNSMRKLKIGEQIPNLPIIHTVNFKGTEKNMIDFRGRLLILDFWATWCGPCISAFPKMENLRQKFKGQIQILPITEDSEQKVGELFAYLKKDMGMDLFSVVRDVSIRDLFNFNKIPHYIWIDQHGRYLGDATQEDMTEEKIQLVLAGKEGVLSKRPSEARQVNGLSPLINFSIPVVESGISKVENIDTLVIRSSTLSKSVEGIGTALQIKRNRFTARNNTLGTMLTYLAAFELNEAGLYSNLFYFFNGNRTIWEVKRTELLDYGPRISELIRGNSPGWRKHVKDHTFCYEFTLGKDTSYKYVAQEALKELNQYFKVSLNLTARIERRKVRCLVLKRSSLIDKVIGNGEQLASIYSAEKTERFTLNVANKPYLYFIMPLVTQHLANVSVPIVDETGFDLKKIVNIQLRGKLSDWKILNVLLEKYDLSFEEAVREIDMVIISDTSTVTGK